MISHVITCYNMLYVLEHAKTNLGVEALPPCDGNHSLRGLAGNCHLAAVEIYLTNTILQTST